MYELVSAIAKPLGGDGRWQAVDIGQMALSQLYATYFRVIATLTNPVLPDLVALDLNDIELDVAGISSTVNEYLAAIGNKALPTTNKLSRIAPKWAKYNDAFKAGYKVETVHPTAGAGTSSPRAELKDLRLTRPNTDYDLFIKNCLVNVNGFYHPIDGNDAGVIVRGGNECAMLSGVNHLGIVSFRELGELTQIAITPQMVQKQNGTLPLKHHAYVDLGQDVSDKSILLVLGGYLHVLDQRILRRVSGSRFVIDFNNLPYLERFFQSRKYLNFSSLPLSTTPRNLTQRAVAELYSDECITAYLTLPQSFFVLLDNSDIGVELEPLRKTKMPNMFTSHVPPIWPIAVGCGKHTNFFASYEDTQWAINCHDALYNNRVFNTVDVHQVQGISEQRDPGDPTVHSNAAFYKVGSQLESYSRTRADYLASL